MCLPLAWVGSGPFTQRGVGAPEPLGGHILGDFLHGVGIEGLNDIPSQEHRVPQRPWHMPQPHTPGPRAALRGGRETQVRTWSQGPVLTAPTARGPMLAVASMP